jgi:phosphoribosylcarboxyaminoimidazole (NCAIR) mutase
MADPTSSAPPLVGIIMGSTSDWPTLAKAAEVLRDFGIPHESKVVSAHRTPELLFSYAKSARERGLKLIIAEPVVPPTSRGWLRPSLPCPSSPCR